MMDYGTIRNGATKRVITVECEGEQTAIKQRWAANIRRPVTVTVVFVPDNRSMQRNIIRTSEPMSEVVCISCKGGASIGDILRATHGSGLMAQFRRWLDGL